MRKESSVLLAVAPNYVDVARCPSVAVDESPSTALPQKSETGMHSTAVARNINCKQTVIRPGHSLSRKIIAKKKRFLLTTRSRVDVVSSNAVKVPCGQRGD